MIFDRAMSPKEIGNILGVAESVIVFKYYELFPDSKDPIHNIKISCAEATAIKKSLPQTEKIKNIQTDLEMQERINESIKWIQNRSKQKPAVNPQGF